MRWQSSACHDRCHRDCSGKNSSVNRVLTSTTRAAAHFSGASNILFLLSADLIPRWVLQMCSSDERRSSLSLLFTADRPGRGQFYDRRRGRPPSAQQSLTPPRSWVLLLLLQCGNPVGNVTHSCYLPPIVSHSSSAVPTLYLQFV